MSQEQDNMEFEHNEDTTDETPDLKKWSFINIFVPVLTLITIVICIVMLVLVANLGKKVDGLEERLQVLQDNNNSNDMTAYESFSDVSDIYSSVVDESEAADIVEAQVLENKYVWDDSVDKSSGIKRVYLTFDDGPSSNTDRILDILDQYGVKATFFVVEIGRAHV